MSITALTAVAIALAAVIRPTHVVVPLGEPTTGQAEASGAAYSGSRSPGPNRGPSQLGAPSATDLEFAHLMGGATAKPASGAPPAAEVELTTDLERFHTRPAALVGFTPGWDFTAPDRTGDPGLPRSAVREVVRESHGRLQE
jgi:hypothetical protein